MRGRSSLVSGDGRLASFFVGVLDVPLTKGCSTIIIADPAQSWGTGMVADFKRTVGTHWVEGMTNFNTKTIPVSLLMYITVIAPTLTFGAVYSNNMNNNIGAFETMIATAWVGCAFALFGGMPFVSSPRRRKDLATARSLQTFSLSRLSLDPLDLS